MKKGLFLLAIPLLFSCTETIDKPINVDDWPEVKELIKSNADYSNGKQRFIIDEVGTFAGLSGLAEAIGVEDKEGTTFRELIDSQAAEYDSILKAKQDIAETNEKLDSFITLKDASTSAVDEYKGYLSFTLDFNNQFEKEVLYIHLNYKYIDKYDAVYFNETARLTDEVAGDFSSEIEVSLEESFNSVSDFIWSKVPVSARQSLKDEMGEEEANRKVERDYLLAGLKITPTKVVFTDKTEVTYGDPSWEYMD